jgi:hypothetical protein
MKKNNAQKPTAKPNQDQLQVKRDRALMGLKNAFNFKQFARAMRAYSMVDRAMSKEQ